MTGHQHPSTRFGAAATFAICLALLGTVASPTLLGERRGRGLTATFEVSYLKTAIDHHFSALRMTELAAGTDEQRDGCHHASRGDGAQPGLSCD